MIILFAICTIVPLIILASALAYKIYEPRIDTIVINGERRMILWYTSGEERAWILLPW